jgi:hypothetical protein
LRKGDKDFAPISSYGNTTTNNFVCWFAVMPSIIKIAINL